MAVLPVHVTSPKTIKTEQGISEDPIDTWLRRLSLGLQIANYGFNIKSNYDKINQYKAEKQLSQIEEQIKSEQLSKARRLNRGIMTVPEAMGVGLTPTTSQEGVPMTVQTPQGEKPQYFFTQPQVRAQEAIKAAERETAKTKEQRTYQEGREEDKFIKDQTNKLRNSYRGEILTKRTENMTGAFQTINSLYKRTKSGINDLAMIVAFAKMIDPGSTVREGEIEMQKKTEGWFKSIMNEFKRLYKEEGQMLSDENRDRLVGEATAMMRGQMEVQEDVDQRYRTFAETYNVDPNQIIPSYNIDYPEINFKTGVPEYRSIPVPKNATKEDREFIKLIEGMPGSK